MRKAIEAFEQEFAQWGLELPARSVADREPGHLDRHGWSLDFSFGTDAFGEYLEYHGRRTVAGEPVTERHTRVYANGERNFIAAPVAYDDPSVSATARPAAGGDIAWSRQATLPPWESMLSEATGDHRRPMSAAPKREAPRGTTRLAPRDRAEHHDPRDESAFGVWDRYRQTVLSLAIGIGGALVVAALLTVVVKGIRGRRHSETPALTADQVELEPIVVFAPSILSMPVDTAAARFTRPLVGVRPDPNRAEVVNPEHGMTPIIPSDPKKKGRVKPAPTSRGGKFHVP